MNIPGLIYAGDTVTWTEQATAEHNSATWSRAVALRHATDADAINVTGVANATGGWDFTVTANQSKTLGVGAIYWHDTVTSGAVRNTIGAGKLEVKANIAGTGTTYEGRTQAQIDLDAVRAAMRARIAGGEVMEYSIGNRSLKKMPMPDLIGLESKLKADVTREARADRIAQGLGGGRSVYVRF